MNSKLTSIILILITIVSLAYGYYSHTQMLEVKAKYAEALEDAQEADKRLEQAKEDLEMALKESEEHRLKAEAALQELQKHTASK